jgi:hypothetical protein
MKTTKKYQLFTALALISSLSINTMDKPKKRKPEKQNQEMAAAQSIPNWAIEATLVILGKSPIQHTDNIIARDKNFTKLSPVSQSIIIENIKKASSPLSLRLASEALHTLNLESEALNQLINDSSFCTQLIKHYSKLLDKNDAITAATLNLPCTLKRLDLQNNFVRDICKKDLPDSSQFKEYRDSGIDLLFTDISDNTPAELCVILNNTEGLKLLLNAGIDPEYIGISGLSLYSIAATQQGSMQGVEKKTIIRILDQAIDEKERKNRK